MFKEKWENAREILLIESCKAIVDAIASFEKTKPMKTEQSLNRNYRILFSSISKAHPLSRN